MINSPHLVLLPSRGTWSLREEGPFVGFNVYRKINRKNTRTPAAQSTGVTCTRTGMNLPGWRSISVVKVSP